MPEHLTGWLESYSLVFSMLSTWHPAQTRHIKKDGINCMNQKCLLQIVYDSSYKVSRWCQQPQCSCAAKSKMARLKIAFALNYSIPSKTVTVAQKLAWMPRQLNYWVLFQYQNRVGACKHVRMRLQKNFIMLQDIMASSYNIQLCQSHEKFSTDSTDNTEAYQIPFYCASTIWFSHMLRCMWHAPASNMIREAHLQEAWDEIVDVVTALVQWQQNRVVLWQ